MTGAWETNIGMEVHAELLTESKMFCSCRNTFGGEPNTRCCPVCLGLPGALPVINRQAVEHVIRTALALHCTISPVTRFDRKNYLYPDLPKGYQISQYDQPIGANGWLDIEAEGITRRVHIRRVHLEEDTGKLMHLADQPGSPSAAEPRRRGAPPPTGRHESAVDYNRSGVPLMEIVTEFPPDMRSAAEARAYLVALRSLLTYIGVSDGRMEQGSLRCEPNVSVRPQGAERFGTKTEIKNLNSLRAVYRGIEYEVGRQIAILEAGGAVTQETLGWNDARQQTVLQRSKELEQEYRYFPEPDLPPIHVDEAWLGRIRSSLPELPEQARARLMRDHGIGTHEADWLTQTPVYAGYFSRAVAEGASPADAASWMMGDLARLLNASGTDLADAKVAPEDLAKLLAMVAKGDISGKMAKGFLERMFETGASPADLAAQEGGQISDGAALQGLIDRVILEQGEVWNAILAGDDRKLTFLMGQIMKASRGKANPQETRRLLNRRIQEGLN